MIITDKFNHINDWVGKQTFLGLSLYNSYRKEIYNKTNDFSEIQKNMKNAEKIWNYLEKSEKKFIIVLYQGYEVELNNHEPIAQCLKTSNICIESELNDESLDKFFNKFYEDNPNHDFHFCIQCMMPREGITNTNPKEYVIFLKHSVVGEKIN